MKLLKEKLENAREEDVRKIAQSEISGNKKREKELMTTVLKQHVDETVVPMLVDLLIGSGYTEPLELCDWEEGGIDKVFSHLDTTQCEGNDSQKDKCKVFNALNELYKTEACVKKRRTEEVAMEAMEAEAVKAAARVKAERRRKEADSEDRAAEED